MNAILGTLTTIVGPDATAFAMPITASGPWSVLIDLSTKWRLASVVVCKLTDRDMGNILRARQNWDLVDDRYQKYSEPLTSNVTLEVA
jgi:hypothetical protein